MDKPAAMVGGYPIGPKCWALMGWKAPRKPAADVVRDDRTIDLFNSQLTPEISRRRSALIDLLNRIFTGENNMTNAQVERDADEAFSIFWKRWHSVCPAELRDIGEPTQIEVWHHAWRASMIAERESCIRLCEGMSSAQNNPFDCADAIRRQTEFLPRKET